MGDVYPKIAGSWVRILRSGAVRRLTMAALLMTGSSALAQENRGTEEQRVACTPDVLRLCSWEIPNVDRIVACLRREKSQLSAGCRQVLKIEATASRAALNNGVEPRHAQRHHFARHRSPWGLAIYTNSAPRRPPRKRGLLDISERSGGGRQRG